ncbi:hypothetical protein ACVOMS_30150 [Bradyrhizobium guangxiense]
MQGGYLDSKSRGHMIGNKITGGRRRGKPPRDLIDFYRRWPEFRKVAVAVSGHADLSPSQRDTVNWLILLADRVGERDLGPLAPE